MEELAEEPAAEPLSFVTCVTSLYLLSYWYCYRDCHYSQNSLYVGGKSALIMHNHVSSHGMHTRYVNEVVDCSLKYSSDS